MIEIKEVFSLIFAIAGIVLVLFLTYYCTRWLSSKTNMGLKSKYMNIVDRIMLGQEKYLAIAEIYGKYYLLSITEKNINILKELEDFIPEPEYEKTVNNIEFNKIFEKFIKK